MKFWEVRGFEESEFFQGEGQTRSMDLRSRETAQKQDFQQVIGKSVSAKYEKMLGCCFRSFVKLRFFGISGNGDFEVFGFRRFFGN